MTSDAVEYSDIAVVMELLLEQIPRLSLSLPSRSYPGPRLLNGGPSNLSVS